MSIGIYDPYLDDLGGGEKYMMTVASCLSQKHDVSIFWNDKKDLEAIEKRFSIDLKKVTLAKNVFSPEISTWKRLQITQKYDVVIILSDGSIPLTLSKKLFLHVQQPLSTREQSSIISKFKHTRVSKVFYNSEFTKGYNKNQFPGVASTIVYPPVSFTRHPSKKENIILHVGRFRPSNIKNQDYKKQRVMIEAFKTMVDHGLKDWKFIIGTGVKDEDKKQYDVLIQSAKGYPIEFLVNKTSEELMMLYGKAKIYWHASGFGEDLNAHPELAEHFGISTVEAMGAGAVPIVINAGGQKEIISQGENGFLWNSLEELEEKTNLTITNKQLWNKLSENAKKRANDFTVEKFCQEIHKLIQ
jgi:glycosyltransferase involved in cell wall biosynthesis